VVIEDFAAACSRNPNKTTIRIASHVNLADARSALSGNEKVRFVYTTPVRFLMKCAALGHCTLNKMIWTSLKHSSHMLHVLQVAVLHRPGFSFSWEQFHIILFHLTRLYSTGHCPYCSYKIPVKMLGTHP